MVSFEALIPLGRLELLVAISDPYIPYFCKFRTFAALVASSELLALLLTLADFSATRGFWPDLAFKSLFMLGVALTSAAILCGLRRYLSKLNPIFLGIVIFLVVQSVTLAATGLSLRLDGFVPPSISPSEVYWRTLLGSSLVTGLGLRYGYAQMRWRRQAQAESEARLEALQARMRPHFLFNSLNTVVSLVRSQPRAAEELLLDLAELFRAILKKDAKWVTLEEELGLARQYLNIERQRLGERLEVAWTLERAPHDALIPPLSLQPLIENAIYHGIEPSLEGGLVDIRIRLNQQSLLITIKNTLPESEVKETRPGTRLALANLKARLDACFPNQTRLLTTMTRDFYQVRMVVPYLTRGHEHPHR